MTFKANPNGTELQTRKPSLIVNALSNYAALGVSIVVGLLLTPFIIKHLGKTGYGIWTLILSFVGYYGLLNLGVNSAITRYIARYAGQNDKEALNKTASTAMAMFCFTGVIVTVLSFLIAEPITTFFKVSQEHFNDFRLMIVVMGVATGISFPGEVFGALLTAHEKYVPTNIVKISQTMIRAGLIVCLLLSGAGLVGVAFAVLGTQLFGLVSNYLIYKRFTPHIQLSLAYAQRDFLRKLLAFGGITMVITIADQIRMNIDSIVIGKWVGMAEVGIYGIAFLLIKYMISLTVSGMSVLTPRFASLHGSNDLESIKRLFIKSLRISGFLAFGFCMGVIIFGGHFIMLWVGKDFVDSIPVLWILSIPFAFALSQNPGIGLMYALKKHYLYAIFTIIEAIANLVLSILLVSKYGIIGVALGTAIPMIIVKLFIQPVYISKIINISVWDYTKPIIPSFILSSVMVLVAYNVQLITYNFFTIPYLIIAATITYSIYISVSFLMLNKRDRNLLFRRIGLKMADSR